MRWPWKRQRANDQLVISWSGQTFSYVLARSHADGVTEVLKFGVERQSGRGAQDMARQLQHLGIKGYEARVMLLPEQYQLLQIEAPAVPSEELRLAARYQIRELLHTNIDDVTLDVMRVGDGQEKGAGHLFVVAAPNAVLREVLELSDAMSWKVSVIDIQESAQRNLQNAMAGREGRASAALVCVEGQPAVLTISANDELFYTRRFELPEGYLAGATESIKSLTPMSEYMADFTDASVAPKVAATTADDDQAKRFLVEVQRSLDLWDRSWVDLPLSSIRVYAGKRSEELSKWLTERLEQVVAPMNVNALFVGFEGGAAGARARCLPLLGVLMRVESRKL